MHYGCIKKVIIRFKKVDSRYYIKSKVNKKNNNNTEKRRP